jgi:hypothetical protein
VGRFAAKNQGRETGELYKARYKVGNLVEPENIANTKILPIRILYSIHFLLDNALDVITRDKTKLGLSLMIKGQAGLNMWAASLGRSGSNR